MVQEALICCLVYTILNTMDWLSAVSTFTRPIVIAPVTGLLLGDLETGIIMGASLEGLFMGISAIGGSIPADSVTASIIAVAFTITTGSDVEAGLAIAMPIGTLKSSFGAFFTPLFAATSPFWEELAASGNTKKFKRWNIIFTVIGYNITTLIVLFPGVAFGTTALEQFLAAVPAFVTTGLNAASGIMMGVGYAILLSMLWRKDVAYFLIVGYVLTVYLTMPTLGVALVGAVIAVAIFLMEKKYIDINNKQVIVTDTQEEAQEEDFFE